MHKQLLKEASFEQLKDFVNSTLDMLKETHNDLYNDLELYLYKELHGCHFTEWLVDKATSNMVNEDGSLGRHWTIEQTTSAAKQYGVSFDKYNEYDWNYTMNMIYSDYYGVISNDLSAYVKLAKRFLEDKDAKEGKALHYYLAMKSAN